MDQLLRLFTRGQGRLSGAPISSRRLKHRPVNLFLEFKQGRRKQFLLVSPGRIYGGRLIDCRTRTNRTAAPRPVTMSRLTHRPAVLAAGTGVIEAL